MAYRQNPWIPERGLGYRSRIIALQNGVDLKKVDGTVMNKGEVKEFNFNVINAARTSTARSALNNCMGQGLIRIEVIPTQAPRPAKKEAPKPKPYVPRDSGKKPEPAIEASSKPELPSDESPVIPRDVSTQLENAIKRTKQLDIDQIVQAKEKAQELETVEEAVVSSSSEESSSDESSSVQPGLNEEALQQELLAIKGVSIRMAQDILNLTGQWTRRNIEQIRFMRSTNVSPVMAILEKYQQ